MPSVYIVGGGYDYAKMFNREGWNVISNPEHADMWQFTGGEDVSPEYYGHTKHPYTGNNPIRDKREKLMFAMGLRLGKPMAGICRGGQFLNVMCGGRMYQDVDGHATRDGHMVHDPRTGEYYWATSTHHQMMAPAQSAVVVGIADISTKREMHIGGQVLKIEVRDNMDDYEVLWYPAQKCFCFQPHPEFESQQALARVYFDYIKEFMELGTPLLLGLPRNNETMREAAKPTA